MASSAPASPNSAAVAAVAAGSPLNRTWLDSRISAGSRRTSAQCWWSTSRARMNCPTVPLSKFQCCAKRAAVRSVRFSPLPPMHSGGCGRCAGLGLQRAPVSS